MFITKKSIRISTALAGILLTIGASGCSKPARAGEGEEKEEKGERKPLAGDRVTLLPSAVKSLKLVFSKATIRTLSPSLEVPAELSPIPDRRATVGPRVAGRVVKVHVTTGQRVKKGDPLVVLQSQHVGRARAQVYSAWARVKVAKRAVKRARRLAKKQIVSASELEAREGKLSIAWADLMAARTQLTAFGVTASETYSTKNPARVVLRSPLTGTVVKRAVHLGRWVKPEDVLVEVVDLSRLWLLAAVYERDVKQIRVGQAVRVAVRAYPGRVFQGTVAIIGSTLSRRTRRVDIRIVLPNPKEELKPGMFATARITGTRTGKDRRLLIIPQSALQRVDGHLAVFVRIKPGQFDLRKVHTGDRAGKFVEVLNGLKAGETVVSEGSFLLKGELLKSSLGEDE